MKFKITVLFLFIVNVSCFVHAQTNPAVVITDQNNTTDVTINCDYAFVPPKKVRLTATFPEIKNPTTYKVDPIAFTPVGTFNQGTPVVVNADDVWSSNLNIGFPFCFYGATYTSLNLADNGIVRFGYNNSVPDLTSFSSISNTTPSPSLIRNAIFAGFQDYLVAPVAFGCIAGDNCGSITTYTTGIAPYRQFVINYNLINHWGCSNDLNPINNVKSTFQVVLYETTNVIDIYVKDKPLTCIGNSSANNGVTNSLIGLNNSDGTLGIAPTLPNRNTSVFSVTNEAYRFTPDGTSTTTVQWFNNAGAFIGSSNPIEVIPTTNTSYSVKIIYNTCTPITIVDAININFDLDYPVAPTITAKYCDVAPPFLSQDGIDIESLLIDATDAVGTIKTIYNSQAEADAGPLLVSPLLGLNNYTMTTPTKTFYYREEIGICYVTGIINLSLYATPVIADKQIELCDLLNDNVEPIIFSTIVNQITGYNAASMGIRYYSTQTDAIDGLLTNQIFNTTVTTTPLEIFIRVFNLSNSDCWTVSKLTFTILPKLDLAPITPFCIADTNFNFQENFDLSTIPLTFNVGPTTATSTYFTTLLNAQNGTNAVASTVNVVINLPATIATFYIRVEAPGFCPAFQPVTINFCAAVGGDGGGNGSGNGGNGGFGACLEIGDAVPTFDLNLVFGAVMAPETPTPIGFYTTLLGAQTEDVAVQLTNFDVLNFTPNAIAPLLFTPIWVRFTDANGVVGIKIIRIPLKYKKHEIVTYSICDVYNDNLHTVNLSASSIYIIPIQIANPGETITCYASQTDYDANTNPITSFLVDYTNAIPVNTIFIKVSSFGCDSDYKLIFNLVPFTIKSPIEEKLCDVTPFGSEPYPNLNSIITSLIPSYSTTSTFSLHSTLNGAFDNSAIIYNYINYPVTATTQIFIRITENLVLDPIACPTIQQINFGFNTSVAINSIPALQVCDTNVDGIETFDINTYINSIISTTNLDPITIRLYSNLSEATIHANPSPSFPDLSNFIFNSSLYGTNATFYLYLLNDTTGCERIVPINLIMQSVNLPTSNTPLKICDFQNNSIEIVPTFNFFNSQVITNSFLYSIQYYLSQADALLGTPQIPANYLLTNGEIIWVKIATASNATCSKIKDYVVSFIAAPIVTNISPKICDDLSDTLETRNLNAYSNLIISNPTNYTFQYYLSNSDALSSLNQQSATYNMTFATNNFAPTIFVKVINNATGCFSIATIIFERNIIIEAFDAQLFSCDISTTNQLEGVFNLTTVIERIGTSGMIVSPINYTISYYTTLPLATAGIVATQIVNPISFGVLANQISYVYVRFVNNSTGCFTVKRIELQIYNLPKFVDGEVFVCDTNLDGIFTYNLTNLNGVVVLVPALFTFKYYLSNADAVANTNEITSNITNYTFTFPISIFVKGTNANGCIKIREVVFSTKPPVPLLSSVVPQFKCDLNNDGIETFNLTDSESQLNIITPSLTFTYFRSLANLQANNPATAILNPNSYTNSATNPLIVFVRLSSSITNCDSYAQINLNILPLPVVTISGTTTICSGENATITFTGTPNTTVTYTKNSINQTIAIGTSGIATLTLPYTSPTGISTTTVYSLVSSATSVINPTPSCSQAQSGTATIVTLPLPVVTISGNNTICSGENATITFTGTPNTTVTYTKNSINQTIAIGTSGIATLTLPYTTPTGISTTTVYSLVSSATNVANPTPSCSQAQSGTVTIVTLPLPLINVMSNYYSCKNLATGLALFNLSTKNSEALAGQNSTQYSVSYHLLNNDALQGINSLPNLFNSVSVTIWVSVKNNLTGCRNVTSLNLVAETATFAIQPSAMQTIICDEFNQNDGLAQFNLEDYNPIILGSQYGNADYQIQYYLSNSDLNSNSSITNLTSFSNTSNPQLIFVKVINNNTVNKCEAIISFNLKVTLLPEPTPKDGAVCFDQITGNLLSNYTIDSGLSTTNHTFEWFLNTSLIPISGVSNSSYEVSVPGNYFVVATSTIAPFCVSEPKLSIVIKSEPAIATSSVEYSFNDNIKVIVLAKGIGQYLYRIDDEFPQSSPIFNNVQPGTHIITVIDENGCADFELEVIVLDYVRFFTPNGDGYNDFWNIKGIKDQPNAKIFLFDRYGKFLKQLSTQNEGWDGTYRGFQLPSDDYWFTVFYVENGQDKVFKSHFALKR